MRFTQHIKQFLQRESASGIVLFMMAVVAMLWANSPVAYIHQQFIESFIFLINDGLMAFFFLVVGLELKRGYLEGQLSQVSQVILPAVAALGGMLFPVFIYCYINADNPTTLRGWATPVATDIAFALGVLSLFGRRVPSSLKLFLLALAIFDDIGAILIIAFCYSKGIAYLWLFQSGVLVLFLYLINLLNVRSLMPYLLIGVWLWFSLLRAGVHPTIAGILLALMIPDHRHQSQSPLRQLEGVLHPWVAYCIMPLFALANAGFSLHGLSWHVLTDVVVLGIALGLFLGKQLGIFSFSWVMVKLRLASLPEKTSWLSLYGIALICGIGFTMSLFLGTLSFEDAGYLADVRLGVIIGSILSGLVGAAVLFIAFAQKRSSVVD